MISCKGHVVFCLLTCVKMNPTKLLYDSWNDRAALSAEINLIILLDEGATL